MEAYSHPSYATFDEMMSYEMKQCDEWISEYSSNSTIIYEIPN
jgi:hypothetical protein